MSAQKPENIEKPEKLTRAENLIDEDKLDEALTLLNNYEQEDVLTHHDKATCHLLQCQILLWEGNHKGLIKLVEQTYKESNVLEYSFLKVDGFLLMAHSLVILSVIIYFNYKKGVL